MIIRFFKSNQQATFFAIPLIVIALWCMGFIKQLPIQRYSMMPIYKLLLVFYSSKTEIVYRVIAMACLIVQAIYLNNVINKHEILFKRSHLPALVYCILMSLFIQYLNLHPILVLNFLLIRLLDNILSFYKSTTNTIAFDSGLIIGVSALIYFPSIVLFLIVLISLIILRPFYWRNWMAAVIGILIPFYFVSIYYFWVDRLVTFLGREIPIYFVHNIKFDFVFSRSIKVMVVTMALVLVLSILKLQYNFFKNAIKTRNYQIVLLFFLFLTAFSFFLNPSIHLEDFSIMALPASIFISYYFLSLKRIYFAELVILLILFLLFYNQIVFK